MTRFVNICAENGNFNTRCMSWYGFLCKNGTFNQKKVFSVIEKLEKRNYIYIRGGVFLLFFGAFCQIST